MSVWIRKLGGAEYYTSILSGGLASIGFLILSYREKKGKKALLKVVLITGMEQWFEAQLVQELANQLLIQKYSGIPIIQGDSLPLPRAALRLYLSRL